MPATRGEEHRKHPRLPVAVRVRLEDETGDLSATTRTIAREGFDLRLPSAPSIGERLALSLHLPSGGKVKGKAECRSRGPDGLCGFALSLDEEQRAAWDAFLDEEESTGSLWRFVARWAQKRHEEKEPSRRYHVVGENGEAYRVCFERHASRPATSCDLMETLPGFRELVKAAPVGRVLDEPVRVRLFEDQGDIAVRLCELGRNGYAWVQGGEGSTTGLVSLAVGEVVLVEVGGVPVFPFFHKEDLERIACDTFRSDLSRPIFTPSGKTRVAPGPAPPPALPEGVDGVVRAQGMTDVVQRRSYGEREIDLYPEVWARAIVDGREVLGPTMRDGDKPLLLALVGSGSPKVVRLSDASEVSLLGRRKR